MRVLKRMSRSVRFPRFVWHALTEPSSDHSTLKSFGRIPSVTVGTQQRGEAAFSRRLHQHLLHRP